MYSFVFDPFASLSAIAIKYSPNSACVLVGSSFLSGVTARGSVIALKGFVRTEVHWVSGWSHSADHPVAIPSQEADLIRAIPNCISG